MKPEKTLLVLKKLPGQEAEVCRVPNSLEALQQTVGGYIELVQVTSDVAILCDEEGTWKGSRFNFRLCGRQFFGTVLVVGTEGEDFCSLPAAMILKVKGMIFGGGKT